MNIRFTGFDSAWGGRERGALCSMHGRVDGKSLSLEISEAPVRVNWGEAVSQIGNWAEFENHVIAIDQGLVVPNLTKQRPVERKLASALMGVYGCGCYSSNRSNGPSYGSDAGIWKFLNVLNQRGYQQNPAAVATKELGKFYFECYPHPAIIALFNLPSVLKYKVNKKNSDDWKKLVRHIRGLKDAELPISNVAEFVSEDFKQCKGNEDILDSVVAAYVAAYFWNFGYEKSVAIGTMSEGYMVTPVNDRMRKLLEEKFETTEINSVETTNVELEPCIPASELVVNDHGIIWGKANRWMVRENCEGWLLYVRFTDVDGEPDVVFGPFDNQGVKQFGMKPWGEESKDNWKLLATGASKENPVNYKVQFRYIPLAP